ncbi:MAG: FHA domain-containing protein [Verrucomicrobiales bacterium]|nr:FHA domain-containing protein [Verrucomicrobiales bacterium]
MSKLIIHIPDVAPLKFGFEGREAVSIGRAEDNDIVIPHHSVSGHHAKLAFSGDGYQLTDLGSTNGTFVDGSKTDESFLVGGERIRFGHIEADYEAAEPAFGHAEPAAPEGSGEPDFEGMGFQSSIMGQPAEKSVRPPNFVNLAPVKPPEKKHPLGVVAGALCVLGFLTIGALAALSAILKIE